MQYFVSVNQDGRVILDIDTHGSVIQSINAEDYEMARLEVNEQSMFHHEGHGYFIAIH